ncbi:hypothetical protein GOP47_0028524 [Adiantum capillus-veneris]|nr:hypothetical protein GOP47_0028524 [Adiantum capillus-veneris]
MAHQRRSGAHKEKNSRKVLNFVRIFVYRGSFEQASSSISATKLDSMKPPPSPSDPPLHSGFTRAFAHNQVSWVHKTWVSVCNALPKHDAISQDKLVEPSGGPLKESPSDDKCLHQNSLEALPSLGKHIMLNMSEKSLARGRALLHDGECSCGSKTDDDGLVPAFVGVFFQTHPKERCHIAHILADGGWARRSLHNFAFARLRGEPGMICSSSSQPLVDIDGASSQGKLDKASAPMLLASSPKLLLRSFRQQILQAVPHQQEQQNIPDKEALNSVQDFFMYTESEGRKVFEELDRDSDGKLTLEDLTVAMKKMKLPEAYAKDFMQSGRPLWRAKHYGWSDFSSLLQEKEPVIVELFNSLGVSNSGTVKSSHVKNSLVKAGLSATEADVCAMMKFLAQDVNGGLKYGQFRRFMLLLPTEHLTQDPWSVWLKAATTHGVESFGEDFQRPILNFVSLLSRNLTQHFDWVAKERAYE